MKSINLFFPLSIITMINDFSMGNENYLTITLRQFSCFILFYSLSNTAKIIGVKYLRMAHKLVNYKCSFQHTLWLAPTCVLLNCCIKKHKPDRNAGAFCQFQ